MTRRFALALAMPLALSAGVASAATFDFGQLADEVKRDQGRELMFGEAKPDGWIVDGITVTTSANGFLDGGFASRGFTSQPSGLGACNAPSGDCNASDWDGVREASEVLEVMFDRVVAAMWTLRETTDSWRRGEGPDHTLANGCAKVNGVERAVAGGAFTDDLGAHSTWTFEPCSGGGSDYYVTAASVPTPPAPVPLPAGAVLLGTALAALGFRARRKAA